MPYQIKVYVIGRDRPIYESIRDDGDVNKAAKSIDGALTENKIVSFGVMKEDEVLVRSENVTHVEITETSKS
ncbi:MULTISPECIES: hypothetical protein [Shouchella]|uniref:DUF2922 domain-containing protein n=2 Tax=Shouchella TaxID=2893057 RepID=A0ABY7W3J3_9BACI|nr:MULTISPECIES: hypothetical protein [Shouchella]MED4128140.1 hypothetical protein [Shouchella miscanthi]WDF02159.1 hypothetical protein PQ477_11545 [Shouchella hunanensis]GAF23136.1 hypothetical protein JCM19047_2929 [Bacillus sp. JCM 19047]